VTRPEPEGGGTAALLRQRGHQVLWLPLLRIEPIANAQFGAGPWAGVLFTSANAVRAIAAHRRFGELANLAVCTVGRRTQAAAAAAGFGSIMSADGDVNALAQLVASKLPVPALAGASLRRGSSNSSSRRGTRRCNCTDCV
jgi:uroporphyrinogen-III synthase